MSQAARILVRPESAPRQAGFHYELSAPAGEEHHAGWLLEDLRDDGMAHGIRRDACVVRSELHAAGGDCGLAQSADFLLEEAGVAEKSAALIAVRFRIIICYA